MTQGKLVGTTTGFVAFGKRDDVKKKKKAGRRFNNKAGYPHRSDLANIYKHHKVQKNPI